jgi:ankyrin repeat protein
MSNFQCQREKKRPAEYRTLIAACVIRDHAECITAFIDSKGDIDAQCSVATGLTPLALALSRGCYQTAVMLIERGANVNLLCNGRAPLHTAALMKRGKDSKMIVLLLSHGAKVNLQDSSGRTALHFACARRRDPLVKLLLDSGADIDIENEYHQTPAELVKHRETHPCMTELILRKHALITFRRSTHKKLLDLALVMCQLKLPAYVVLWTIDFLAEYAWKPEIHKIRLLEGVWKSRRIILLNRALNKQIMKY